MNTQLYKWAQRWGVPTQALAELQQLLAGEVDTIVSSCDDLSEAGVTSRVRLEAAKEGVLLMRNNVGAFKAPNGQWVRYGLMNDSKQMNERIKSSDWIGIRPGGQFVAREVKHSGWAYKGTKHEEAQLRFIELINSYGGDAKFVNEGF